MQKRLFIGSVLMLFSSSLVLAAEPPAKSLDAVKASVQLGRTKSCDLAVGLYFPEVSAKLGGTESKPIIQNHIFCIVDIKTFPGTKSQRKGCSLTGFDLVKMGYVNPPISFQQAALNTNVMLSSQKDCDQGGFEEVMNEPVSLALTKDPATTTTVKKLLLKGPAVINIQTRQLYVRQKYADLWKKIKSEP